MYIFDLIANSSNALNNTLNNLILLSVNLVILFSGFNLIFIKNRYMPFWVCMMVDVMIGVIYFFQHYIILFIYISPFFQLMSITYSENENYDRGIVDLWCL